MLNSFTTALTQAQVTALRELLEEQGFEFAKKAYMIFFAEKGKVALAVYEKGPKVVVQGKETEDFVKFQLEPYILKEARLGYEEALQPEMFQPHFGVDESGKGDFFGPLVIAGVYVEGTIARALLSLGVVDSKKIGSDQRIYSLAQEIRKVPGIVGNVVMISPVKYNSLYQKFKNLNDLLAWGHARVIENLIAQKPECKRSLSDKFANERVIERALLEKGKAIEIQQRTKAESDIAVAAASVMAREKFVTWLDRKSKELEVTLPKGVSLQVKEAAQKILERHGAAMLPDIAKMHFRTSTEVLDLFSKPPLSSRILPDKSLPDL
ncbi:MAG: ribonuclease HIII [Verrucomicrobia bacterium]|nr:ribonuclease HIII [Verrucomicrobiota bacterium]MBV9672815.1 ribonuclease HIII [Verrucomicrobiota bacterium]